MEEFLAILNVSQRLHQSLELEVSNSEETNLPGAPAQEPPVQAVTARHPRLAVRMPARFRRWDLYVGVTH